MSVSGRISPSPADFMKRLAKLPAMMNEMATAYLKRDAVELVQTFQNGIKNDELHLDRLAEMTMDKKEKDKMPAPDVPLYGKGPLKPAHSYQEMMRIRKLKRGYRVAPSWAKHWKAPMELRELFKIHEYGCIVVRGKGESAKMVRIPPRPAFLRSYEMFMRRRQRGERSKTVEAAVNRFLATANEKQMMEQAAAVARGVEKYYQAVLEGEA